MPVKGSRYEKGVAFAGDTDNETGRKTMFRGTRPRPIGPASPVLEYTVKEGDRLDLLSLYFYNKDRKWWRILDANPDIIFGADLSLAHYVGETILIPVLTEPGGEQ